MILEISNIAYNGDILLTEQKRILNELLKEKKYRLFFLSFLNKYRSNGVFTISKNSYETIGNIMLNILDEVIKEKDYECARYCIILSQTYHYFDELDNTKYFLQKKIENHELLKMSDFWENFIACKNKNIYIY
jgi:hypothetical protein